MGNTLQIKAETAVGLFIVVAVGVFFYMGFQVGSFRFDKGQYHTYFVLFKDVSGLGVKGDVKVAGVKVGWVEALALESAFGQVRATILVKKEYMLYADAYGVVRQDGLLGSKFLELVTGDPRLSRLLPGGVLSKPSRDLVSIDDLLHEFKTIATDVHQVTTSLKDVFGGQEGENRIKRMVDDVSAAAQKLASFTQSIDRIIVGNEKNINELIGNMGHIATSLREEIPQISSHIRALTNSLAGSVDRDFNRIATGVEEVSRPLQEVAQKINDGKGILGQLLNDQEAFTDVKTAIKGLKDYFVKVDRIGVDFDVHTESMCGTAESTDFKESKAYVNVLLKPYEDYFYLAGVTATRKGVVDWVDKYDQWYDEKCKPIYPSALVQNGTYAFPSYENTKIAKRNKLLPNLQFGKQFSDLIVRAGLFEGTGGVGIDYTLPFSNGRFKFETTFEAFDWVGANRVHDDLPHLKWLNRLYMLDNFYLALGADDFISKHNANAFVGVGFAFGDDDVKTLLSKANFATS